MALNPGKRSRFGFFRYVFDDINEGAVKQFDGTLLHEALLSVSFAKFPVKQHANGGRVATGRSPGQVEKTVGAKSS